MLLEALAACAGVTMAAVATSIGVDLRGTLGVSKEAPVGFREIRLSFDIDTDAPADQVETLRRLTERYCVVYQTLRTAPPIAVSMNGRKTAD